MVKKIKNIFKGFTLIELIIVIGVVAILSTGAFLLLNQRLTKGRDARKIADINSLSKGVLIYELENFGYPAPSNSISLTDQYGNEIGKQGLFDKAVVDQLSSIHKTVKDPFTNEYYSYTTYDKYRGFEIGTFMEAMGKVTYNIHSKTFADSTEEINPYVFVYGKVKVCEDNGEIKYPNPISVYDNNNFKYANTKTMGRGGKIMFNMKYLNGSKKVLEGTGSLCDGEVQAPIVGYQSYNTGMNLKQTHKEQIVDTNDGILEIIQEECTLNGLCNSPDIYRVRYNLYIIVYYNPTTGEITLIEAEYNPETNKFEKKTKEVIFNGSGTSTEKGKIYGITTSPNGKYQIYYGGGNGGVEIYTQGGTGGSGGAGGTKSVVGGAGSQYETMKFEGGVSIAQGVKQSVITFSQTGTNDSYIATISESGGISQNKVIKIPYECRMPRIIYLNEDTYIIMYIDEEGNPGIGKVEYKSATNEPNFTSLGMQGTLDNVSEINMELVWSNVIATTYKSTDGSTYVKTRVIDGNNLVDGQTMSLDSGTLSNIIIKSGGKGDLNITYTKGTSSISKYYQISTDGDITIKNSTTINCTNPTLSQLSSTEFINSCGGSTGITKIQNEQLNISENGNNETEGKRIVNVPIDSSWAMNTTGGVYNDGSIKIGTTKSASPTSKFTNSFKGTITNIIDYKIGTKQYIGAIDSSMAEANIYEFNGSTFVFVQALSGFASTGYGGALFNFQMNGETYLGITNNMYSKRGTADKKTMIFKRNGSQFDYVQNLESGLNLRHFTIDGTNYVILNRGYKTTCTRTTMWSGAEYYPSCTSKYQQTSIIYRWDTGTNTFVTHSSIKPKYENNYITNSDIAQINGSYYLVTSAQKGYLLVNCGARMCELNRPAVSEIFKWNGSSFSLAQSIVTDGYLDFLDINNKDYLYIKNPPDYKTKIDMYSLSGSLFVPEGYLLGTGAINLTKDRYSEFFYKESTSDYLLIGSVILPQIFVNGKWVYDTSYKYTYLFKYDGTQYNLLLNGIDQPGSSRKITLGTQDYLYIVYKNIVYFYELGEQSITNNYVIFSNTLSRTVSLYNGKKITNIEIDETKPAGTDIKYLISFDRQNTFRTKKGDEWEIVNDGEIGTKGMSSEELKSALIGYEINENAYIDFKIGLISSDPSKTSSIQGIRITYDKE